MQLSRGFSSPCRDFESGGSRVNPRADPDPSDNELRPMRPRLYRPRQRPRPIVSWTLAIEASPPSAARNPGVANRPRFQGAPRGTRHRRATGMTQRCSTRAFARTKGCHVGENRAGGTEGGWGRCRPDGPCRHPGRRARQRAPGVEMAMPSLIADAGDDAARSTLEFFTARIPHRNTREAYGRAIVRFCAWCAMRPEDVQLRGIAPPTIAAYLESLQPELSVASIKLQLAALRHWLKWLTQSGVLAFNPAESVLAPKLIVQEGKTSTFEREDGRRLFDSVAADDLLSKRDRVILGVAMFAWGRIGAIVKMRVCDFIDEGDHAKIVLREKGGK